MSSGWEQLRAIVGLRWRMVRTSRGRRVARVLAVAIVAIFSLAIIGGRLLPQQQEFNAAALFPTALLAYAALSIVGPLTTGGGNELFPPDEVVPHPIRATTTFAGSVILAPLNIAWVGQTAGLLALAAYVADSWHGVPASCGLTVLFALVATVLGQAIGWWLAGLAHTARGRRITTGLAVAVATGAVVTLQVGITTVLDRAPTAPLALAILLGARGEYDRWLVALGSLIAIGAASAYVGPRAVGFALRQPPGVNAERSARVLVRRPPRSTIAAELRTVDRSSVWRSPPLRRGVVVLGLLPGAAVAAFRVDWAGLAMAGGLVTAGAGLLFGINAFCLDGSGALWLASSPVRPGGRVRSKARIVLEVCLASAAITVLAGILRAKESPTLVDVATVLACVVACSAVVTARCLRSSIVRPHRADLRGARDTPAPHGAMAVESAVLASLTTLTCLVIVGFAAAGSTLVIALMTTAVLALAGRSLLVSFRCYEHPDVSGRVAVTVASG